MPDFEDIASDRTVFHANDSAVPKTDVSHSFPLETIQMWRSMFVALGIMALIFGIECLMIDSAVLYSGKETTAVDFFDPTSRPADLTKTWQPSEWMPWAILSIGAVVVLYSFTLPRRFRNNVAVGA